MLAASLLLMSFCAGASWQKYFYRQPSQLLLQESPQAKLIQWDSRASIIVHVAGFVNHPGIVHLPRGSRVRDAIKKAGGVLPQANTSKLNLAAIIPDGQQVRVEPIAEKQAIDKSTFAPRKAENTSVNINLATEEELQLLPDVGPVMAARIVAHRKSYGAFESLDDLNAVKGIGPKTIQKLQPYIVFH